MDARTEEALASLKARLLTAKYTKAETLGVPPYVLQGAADTIERQAKELSQKTADVAGAEAETQLSKEIRNELVEQIHTLNDSYVIMKQKRDAALAEVERLKAEIGELAGKWAGDMAADLLSGVSTVKD